MPYYEYCCRKCGNIKEEFFPSIPRTIPDVTLKICGCTGEWVKHDRVMSTPNFHLKGTCWAKDGYSMQYQDGSRVVSINKPNERD